MINKLFNRFNRAALLFIPIIIFSAFLFTTSCTKSSNNGYGATNITGKGPGPDQVWMQNTKFVPSTITISVNGTVTWTNKDAYAHDVTANDSSFYSVSIPAGGAYSHQFTVAGTYNYHCAVHSGMNGTVIVK